MNKYKDRGRRQQATEEVIIQELIKLREGYNPIKNKILAPAADIDYLIHPETGFSAALQKAFDLFEGESKTDLKSSLKYIQLSVKSLNLQDWAVKDIKKRHILRVLNNCQKVKEDEGRLWSNNQYNHYRTALIILYSIFLANDTVEHNIVEDVPIKKHAAKKRTPVSKDQFQMIDRRLHHNNYRLWLFVHIYFYSLARLTELARLKGSDVNLDTQNATYLVKKGKDWTYVIRPIPDEAVPLWRIALRDCGSDRYIFSEGLRPGMTKISPTQYTRRWKVWVKNPVPDEATKYHPKEKERPTFTSVKLSDLRHTRITQISNQIDRQMEENEKTVAEATGHTTTTMLKKVYDLNYDDRRSAKIRKMNINLG